MSANAIHSQLSPIVTVVTLYSVRHLGAEAATYCAPCRLKTERYTSLLKNEAGKRACWKLENFVPINNIPMAIS